MGICALLPTGPPAGTGPARPHGVPAEINKSGAGFPTPHEVRHKIPSGETVLENKAGCRYNGRRRSEMLLFGRAVLLHRDMGDCHPSCPASIDLDTSILLDTTADCKGFPAAGGRFFAVRGGGGGNGPPPAIFGKSLSTPYAKPEKYVKIAVTFSVRQTEVLSSQSLFTSGSC